jgi:GNAT superfamily N-acetyltransferase
MSSIVELKQIELGDQYLNFIREAFSAHSTRGTYFSLFDQGDTALIKRLNRSRSLRFSVISAGKAVGFALLIISPESDYNQTLAGEGVAVLELLCIDESQRRNRLGLTLLAHLKERAHQSGCMTLRWDCPASALDSLRFYLQAGARVIGFDLYNDFPELMVTFELY